MEKKTALYDCHVASGGTMVPFAGHLLPMQYSTGIIAEHNAVRQAAGLFDVSHMGEIYVAGARALEYMNYLMTNDFTSMADDQVRYSVMCNEQGGCIDDLLVYRIDDDKYWVIVNAANRKKDFEWMRSHIIDTVNITDESHLTAQIALQGPLSKEILLRLVRENSLPEKYYTYKGVSTINGKYCLVSQTGYTGENGYELYMRNEDAVDVWNSLLEAGRDKGLIPCGLGARDTLRLEAAMPLYGHEMDAEISPLETGLKFAVKMQKDDFIGKKALEERGTPLIKRVGLKVTGRGIAREQQDVYLGDTLIGRTTSGTFAPFLKVSIAMALVEANSVEVGSQVEIDIRGRRVAAEVVPLPFYKKN